MESGESERDSCSDESDEDEHGLKNAYSVGDLLQELSSDSDNESKPGGKDPDYAVQDPDDSICLGSNLPMNDDDNVFSEKPEVEPKANVVLKGDGVELRTVPDGCRSVSLESTYSRVYDEVLVENIYQEPVENDDDLITST